MGEGELESKACLAPKNLAPTRCLNPIWEGCGRSHSPHPSSKGTGLASNAQKLSDPDEPVMLSAM